MSGNISSISIVDVNLQLGAMANIHDPVMGELGISFIFSDRTAAAFKDTLPLSVKHEIIINKPVARGES